MRRAFSLLCALSVMHVCVHALRIPKPRHTLPAREKAAYDRLLPAAKAFADMEIEHMGSFDAKRTRIDDGGRFYIVEDSKPAPAAPITRRAVPGPPSGYTPEGAAGR